MTKKNDLVEKVAEAICKADAGEKSDYDYTELARAAIAVTIEACAEVCEKASAFELTIAHASGEATNGAVRSTKACAQAIRSLMEAGE